MNWFLPISLLVVCFYDAIILLLLPSNVTVFFTPDGSAPRFIVNFLALGIGLLALSRHGFRVLPNMAIGAFLLIMVVSSMHSPNIQIDSAFLPKDFGIYNYKPMFEMLILFLMFMGIYSLDLRSFKENIFKTMAWIGVIYGGYIIFQHIGLDQFYIPAGQPINQESRNPECGAFICQPVFAAAMIAMCLPFIIKQKSWWKLGIALGGIILTGNRSAEVAAALSVMFMHKATFRISLVLLVLLALGIVSAIIFNFIKPDLINLAINPSGRLDVWDQVIMNIAHSKFPGIDKSYLLTGYGIGSFSTIFPFYNHSGFHQAHFEYLEVLFCMGIAGSIAMVYALKHAMCHDGDRSIGAALLAIGVCAVFNPVWHIPQLQFVTVLFLGLYYQSTRSSNDMEIRATNRVAEHRELQGCAG